MIYMLKFHIEVFQFNVLQKGYLKHHKKCNCFLKDPPNLYLILKQSESPPVPKKLGWNTASCIPPTRLYLKHPRTWAVQQWNLKTIWCKKSVPQIIEAISGIFDNWNFSWTLDMSHSVFLLQMPGNNTENLYTQFIVKSFIYMSSCLYSKFGTPERQ